jgi:hypothetical protein
LAVVNPASVAGAHVLIIRANLAREALIVVWNVRVYIFKIVKVYLDFHLLS